jgi:hypothetical protein
MRWFMAWARRQADVGAGWAGGETTVAWADNGRVKTDARSDSMVAATPVRTALTWWWLVDKARAGKTPPGWPDMGAQRANRYWRVVFSSLLGATGP